MENIMALLIYKKYEVERNKSKTFKTSFVFKRYKLEIKIEEKNLG